MPDECSSSWEIRVRDTQLSKNKYTIPVPIRVQVYLVCN
jgi:hypothetical protein